MKPSFPTIGIAIVLIATTSCGNAQQPSGQSAPPGVDIPSSKTSSREIFQMKEMHIDMEYVFPDGEHIRGTRMDQAAYGRFKPDHIDEFFMPEDTYFVADSVASSSAGRIYLIVKDDPNEVSGWLVIYTPDMQVADQLEVYYENAEGNFYLSTEIKNNLVTCTGENITPEDNPVSVFKIIEGPKWHLIQD